MRILFLAQRVPYPPDRGDKIPTFNYVRHLSKTHDVTVVCLADGPVEQENARQLRSFVHAVDAVALSPTRARMRSLCALAGNRPLTVAYFDEPEMREVVRRHVASGQIDLAMVFSSGVAQFVEEFAELPRVIQFADLDSQKWAQYAQATSLPKSWVYRTESERMLACERRLATTFSRSLVCSQRECDDFRQLIPEGAVEALPNGVDLNYFRPDPTTPKVKDSLVFTGVMDYRPNVDGVVWFCREVLPLIRSQVPDVTFTICGSSPDRNVRRLEHEPGVTVTGDVPDVRPYLSQAAAAVVPLRMARGIQNKLLEAMAMGLPCVTTPAAWAGIEAEVGRDLLVAKDPTEFADATAKLLMNRQLRETVGLAGRAAVEAGYRWERTLGRLEEIVIGAFESQSALSPQVPHVDCSKQRSTTSHSKNAVVDLA